MRISIRGEKLGEKESSVKKLRDARGEGNGAEGVRRGSGFSSFVNGDDSSRFPTRGESMRGPEPVEKRKKEELCWLRQML